ncbi:uncharacterized protein (DUF885 family) [Pelomonas saccharophila]|uniref:Uncharacterized protein (DUF885 family) n=1 Tax=Roseateles saccharophilus TaxID=304 RepID=A0ABU1YV77_ROSSA|nr:DUF885 domain-containing protein [Roseateles saccharophilus]MDR7272764.1 uncharacterized protein (DUF885 family) [Roseateles saccharophilus]
MRPTLVAALIAGLHLTAPAAAQTATPKPPATAPDAATKAHQALQALFDEAWESETRAAPEWATLRGDLRFNDKLSDRSEAGIAARDAFARDMLARARAVDASPLNDTDRVSLALFIHRYQQDVALQGFAGWRTLTLGTLSGAQSALAGFARNVPVNNEAQVRQWLARLAAYPARVDQEIAILRHGLALGWVTSRPVLARAIAQIEGQLPEDVTRSPVYEPFTRMTVDASVKANYQAQGQAAMRDIFYPAQRKLLAVLKDELGPKAPESGSLSTYPGGDRVYEALILRHVTLPLAAGDIHATGLRETARIRAEMEKVKAEAGFDGDLAAFKKFLYSDPKFLNHSAEELLDGYRSIAKRIDPELPKLFAQLPRSPYGIRGMPPYTGEGAADNYNGPSLDGTTPGWFNANAIAFKRRPKWAMETLVAHETVPGHHLQISRQVELGELPNFRRQSQYSVFSEGWALYAETLGPQIGLFRDPYARFGHLQAQMFRAARLVVDTGLHALGWSRDKATAYMIEQTGHDATFMTAEVDRYLAQPGQALSYMMGELKIKELRARAEAALGARFDQRRFHMALIDQGAMPLPLLEQRINAWIHSEKARP